MSDPFIPQSPCQGASQWGMLSLGGRDREGAACSGGTPGAEPVEQGPEGQGDFRGLLRLVVPLTGGLCFVLSGLIL